MNLLKANCVPWYTFKQVYADFFLTTTHKFNFSFIAAMEKEQFPQQCDGFLFNWNVS